jgi:thiol-disulfide isomerase/thioredoxin
MNIRRCPAIYKAYLALSLGMLVAFAGCSEPQAQVTAKSSSQSDKKQSFPKPQKNSTPKATRTPATPAPPDAKSVESQPTDSKPGSQVARPKSIDSKTGDSEPNGETPQPLDLTVPTGGVEEIAEYLLKLDQVRLEEDSPQAIAEFVKVQKAIIAGADKLLARSELDEEKRLMAIVLKWSAASALVSLDDPGAEERFLALAKELVGDKNQNVAKIARIQLRQIDINRTLGALVLGTATSTEKLLQDLQAILSEDGLRYGQFTLVRQAAKILESLDKYEDAAKVYKAFEQAFAKSGEEALAEAASQIATKAATRLGWLGKEAEVAEARRDGQKFDLSEYKGKVVLVDFWATWCGPCLAELPNVIENYKKYHDRGFEVVGISLDNDQERLDKFFKENDLPWPTLWTAKIADQLADDPFEHPLAKKYGVDALPSTLLVDQQGKVVALGVSGKRLGKKLGELLGEPDEPESKSDDN